MNEYFVRNRLSDYIDGTLPPHEHEEIQKALAENAELYAEYQDLKETVSLLKDSGLLAPSRDLTSSIMERIEEEAEGNVLVVSFRKYGIQMALVASILIIATAILLPEKHTENTIAAAVVTQTPPKSRPIQLPKNLHNRLEEKGFDATQIALANEEPEPEKYVVVTSNGTPKTSLSRPNPQKRIEPLVLDQPKSREDSPYLLYMDDPEILFKLSEVAEKNNSLLTQRDGSALLPYSMNNSKSAQVVTLTTDAKNILGIEAALRQLGAEFYQFSTPAENGSIKIQINIQFE